MVLDGDENILDNYRAGTIFEANFSFTYFEGLNIT
jgi:hypothetical protein